jgi:phenylpropionate dioxygenase-like ring-hydroxylating dioxygenase large terminal subunit
MAATTPLADDLTVVQRILDHIDGETTDRGAECWREPVANYRSADRFSAERALLRRRPVALCPSAALPEPGSFVAREAGGTPLVAVRGSDQRVRVFRNACRHRGAPVAAGSGCQRAFMCRYHGWTYGLDGTLRHVPHEDGFPGLVKASRGLVPVEATEAQGLVFVTQEPDPKRSADLHDLPPLISPRYRLLHTREIEVPVNWKIFVEGFLEGYHIRSTHPQSFYPVQYDNLNVVEQFGPNNRVTFPYRAVEKLRGIEPRERKVDGKLTYVYQLFPNVMVATFPGRIIQIVIEPETVDRSRQITYVLSDREEHDDGLKRGGQLVDAGGTEDREVVCAIQRSLSSGANEFFEFGLFEGAIVHFHRTLHAALGAPA